MSLCVNDDKYATTVYVADRVCLKLTAAKKHCSNLVLFARHLCKGRKYNENDNDNDNDNILFNLDMIQCSDVIQIIMVNHVIHIQYRGSMRRIF